MYSRSAILVVCIVLLVFSAVVIAVCWWLFNDPEATDAERQLIAELNEIIPPGDAVFVEQHSSHKPRSALAGICYHSKLTYVELSDYYDHELARRGWSLLEESSVKDWGRDLGGRTRRYRKNQFIAEFFYPGQNSQSGYTYGLNVSWGLNIVR